jgi:hypothetical protein
LKLNTFASAFAIGLVVVATTGAAFADEAAKEKFDKKHPRRAQVLNRANREEGKNNAAAVNGKITDKQARKLDRQDQKIKREEQAQAAANGGHITKQEQRMDNRQENRVNKERDNMEKKDAAAGATAPAAPAGGSQ